MGRKNNDYKPNLNDKRIRKKLLETIPIIKAFLPRNKIRQISQTWFTKHFGSLNHDLPAWMKQNFVEIVNPYYNPDTGVCITYRACYDKMNQVLKQLNYDKTIDELSLAEVYADELKSGDFKMTPGKKTTREYHSIQYLGSEERTDILSDHGYLYHYDLVAAAPTLLSQAAKARVLATKNQPLVMQFLDEYCADRTQIRQKLAQECQCSAETIKMVINSLLQGAVLTTYGKSKLFIALGRDKDLVKRLQDNIWLTGLRTDLSALWQALKPEFNLGKRITLTGKEYTQKISSKLKAQKYQEKETQVMNVIKKHFKDKGARFFSIHDGWASDICEDPLVLNRLIYQKLHYEILVDLTVNEKTI